MIIYHNCSMPALSTEEELFAVKTCDSLLSGDNGMSGQTGWLYPERTAIENILSEAEHLRKNSKLVFVVGIGGSYLGAKAAIDLLRPVPSPDCPEIEFVGHTLSGSYLSRAIKKAENTDFSLILISKSGNTLEVSANSRLFLRLLQDRYGAGAKERLVIVTGSSGPLRSLAEKLSCPVFSVPEDVGGRYSVFTPVGLLPMAVAGIDIATVLRGAVGEGKACREHALSYAAGRYRQFQNGKRVEMLCSYRPEFRSLAEWWRQLFAESEGKNGLGLFPAYAEFPADLHSIGQYIQQGSPILFETILDVQSPDSSLFIPDSVLRDGRDYLTGLPYCTAETASMAGVTAAHSAAGIPIGTVVLPSVSEESLGALMQFFMISCGISACLLGVDPFNQPGVESYKKHMLQVLKG